MNVGAKIKSRRKELGYNADFLAKHLGVSRSTVFRYENGEIEKVPTDILEKLSIILDTTPGYFMGWEEDINEQLLNSFNQLTQERKYKVVKYTSEQLEQQKEIDFSNNEDPQSATSSEHKTNVSPISKKRDKQDENRIYTIAASSLNPKKKVTKQELDELNSFLDSIDEKEKDTLDKYKK